MPQVAKMVKPKIQMQSFSVSLDTPRSVVRRVGVGMRGADV